MKILIKKKKDMWNYVHELKHYLFMPKNRNALPYVTDTCIFSWRFQTFKFFLFS